MELCLGEVTLNYNMTSDEKQITCTWAVSKRLKKRLYKGKAWDKLVTTDSNFWISSLATNSGNVNKNGHTYSG